MPNRTIVEKRGRPALPLQTAGTSNVSQEAWATLLNLTPSRLIRVDEASAGGLPAIARGVDMISNAVSTMLVSADVFAGTEARDVPPIIQRPNVLLTPSEAYDQMVRCLLLRGNYVAVLADYDEFGAPQQLVPVHPDSVSLDTTSGYAVYRIGDHTYGPADVLHIRSHTPVGSLWGQGIIERHRTALSAQLHGLAYGEASFSNGAVPSAVITLDAANVPAEVASQVQSDWIDRHGNGQRKPAVVPKTMTVTPLSFSPHDAEWVASQQLNVAQAAYIVGLDPSDLSASTGGSGLTYANLTQRQIARIQDAYSPWIRVIEESLSDILPAGLRVVANIESLFRNSTAERYALHEQAIRMGLYDLAHAQELERLPVTPVEPAQQPEPQPEETP